MIASAYLVKFKMQQDDDSQALVINRRRLEVEVCLWGQGMFQGRVRGGGGGGEGGLREARGEGGKH